MKYSDIKRLYPASGYMKTSVVDGRTVIDKHYDASNDRAHAEWAGNDRPELHQNQACVEKEATNYIPNSENFESIAITHFATVAKIDNPDTFNSEYILTEQEGDETRYGAGTELLHGSGIIFANSVTVRDIDTRYVALGSRGVVNSTGHAVAIFDIQEGVIVSVSTFIEQAFIVDSGGGWYDIGIRQDSDVGTNLDRFTLYFASPDGSSIAYEATGGRQFEFAQTQSERSFYPTLYIPTTGSAVTRPEPLVPIDNFLLDTGTVGWCGRMVRDDSQSQYIYTNDGDFSTQRHEIALDSSNRFSFTVWGSDGGRINNIANPFTWANNEFKDLIGLGSYGATDIHLWLCDLEGNLYGYTASYSANDTSEKGIVLGTRPSSDYTSIRTTNLQSTTEVIDTAEKAAEMIEELTKGSYNLKASEITHQNPS